MLCAGYFGKEFFIIISSLLGTKPVNKLVNIELLLNVVSKVTK